MAEVLGAASAAIQLLEVAITAMRRLRKAFERQKELIAVLRKHDLELNNLKSLVQTVKNEPDLEKDDDVGSELEKLRVIEKNLVDHLKQIDPEGKGSVQQFTHQLFHGSKEERKLTSIMGDLSRAKLDLSFRVQVASVGIIRDVGDAVLVNAKTINRIDSCLRELLGEGKGLRIAKLLRDGCSKDQDGNVHLKREDIEEALKDEQGTHKSDQGAGYAVYEKVRIVSNNIAENNSLVIGAPIGGDLWEDMDRIEVKDNKAIKHSTVVAYPIGSGGFEFTKSLLDRQERMADKERQARKEEREAERSTTSSKY